MVTDETYLSPRARVRMGADTPDVSLPVTPVTALRQLARDLSRLRPDWRDPERYFENRSELERALQRLARQLEQSR